jgi:hypothetical protein
MHVGRFNAKKGWCRLSQTELAEKFDCRRQGVNEAVRDLVKWDYLQKKDQAEAGESFCLYRVRFEDEDSVGGVSGIADTPVRSTGHPCPPRPDTPKKRGIATRARVDQSNISKDQRSFENSIDDRRPALPARFVSEDALEKVRKLAPGWDRQALLAKFNAWPGSKTARDLDAAFLGWVPKFTKGQRP